MSFSSWNIPRCATKSQLCAIIDLIAPDLEVKWSSPAEGYTAYEHDNPIATVTHNGVRTMVSTIGTTMGLPTHLQPKADDE